MAKIRHRTFEMFDGLQEAIDALTTKSARVNAHSLDPDLWRFHQLDIAIQPSGIVHVTFKPDPDSASESSASESSASGSSASGSTSKLEKDLSDLSKNLSNGSRVLLDFAGLLEFDSDSLVKLSEFENKLRAKGSRVVLCNIEPEVHASFFPQLSKGAKR